MTRLEELTLNLADDVLSDAEARELEALLAESEQARQAHIRILQIEAGLRAQRDNPELAAAVMARLRSHVTESVAQGVMRQIRTQPTPEWVRLRDSEPDDAKPASRTLSFSFLLGWLGRPLKRVWLPLAACLALLIGGGVWLFGPTVGQPSLAEVQGSGLSIVRAGQPLPAVAGMRLQTADVLRTPENVTAIIGFAPEATRVTLQPGTDLTLTDMSRGKRFDLRLGKLEASVARQRPFRPMIITTPQAEARVVGTRFSSLVTNDVTRLDVIEGTVRFTRTMNGATAKVTAGNYAVAAANYELAALPQTGGLLREWWYGGQGQPIYNTLTDDPRFPARPDSRDTAPNFELTVAQTNQVRVRLRGYLQPPVTGDYRFWLEQSGLPGSALANLLMSTTSKSSEAVLIARSGGHAADKAPPPIPLVAGRSYYIEAQVMLPLGAGHFSITWQPPGGSRQLLTGEFMSPFKAK